MQQLDQASRRELGPFECFGCGNALIARLPQQGIAKHFAHKQQCHCSGETYLHALAKDRFASAYRRAVAEGVPFTLSRTLTYTCRYFEESARGTCNHQLHESFDLTKIFPTCGIEKQVRGFIGDVVLSSADGADFLLVEFAVSHRCSEDKLNSGLRIAEVLISEEDDVIESCDNIDARKKNVRLYNFRTRKFPKVSCRGKCSNICLVLLVYRSGKARLVEMKPQELSVYEPPDSVAHYRGMGLYEEEAPDIVRGQVFEEAVRAAHLDGVPIRNCFNCKYHGTSFDVGVFCRIKKKELNSNTAAECNKYRTLRTKGEYEAMDRRNEEFWENAPAGYIADRFIDSEYF